ncbi:hypothetical protein GQ600_10015 [Phytophthora cactorum]|nr:hypothetical protein GQ600_10015 [Phytophthora cactorum]
MYEHDTFKRLKDMSGAGWNSEVQAPTLSDEVWENLSKTQPRNASLMKRFREEGFAHDDVCSLIAGDSRATAAESGNIVFFATNEVDALLRNSPDMQDSAEEEATSYDGSHEDQATRQDPPAFSSPSIAERTERIKRYRDGRKKKSSQVEESAATMTSFFKTAERYSN